jgi:hypothetical protein
VNKNSDSSNAKPAKITCNWAKSGNNGNAPLNETIFDPHTILTSFKKNKK